MEDSDLLLINSILKAKNWLVVTDEIVSSMETEGASGKIEIPTTKGTLILDVEVSENFPLGPISFICKNIKGYEHEMPSGLLCLLAAPASALEDRLELELEKLWAWVQRYYIEEQNDLHFDYYHFAKINTHTLIFEEDTTKPPIAGTFGKFKFASLRLPLDKSKDENTWIATSLGSRDCRWSKTFLKVIFGSYIGLWAYIKKAPVIQRRETVQTWDDLLNILSEAQTKFIYDQQAEMRKHTGVNGGFFLALGYDIPADQGTEIHWENIFIPFNKFPFTTVKENGKYYPSDLGFTVNWSKTLNASYGRVFGRGKLVDEICNSKILVIGTGAIGSNLVDLLVRGGVRTLDFHDSEQIEPGNICRGRFSFTETDNYKVGTIYYESIRINPYVEIDLGFSIKAIRKNHKDYKDAHKKLSAYDYIFDCSTDKYLSLMLDEMQLPGCLINLSISDEARQMAVITGTGNIHKIKNSFYNRISNGITKKPFFVAQGCWHPTFKASMSDISLLVSYAVSEINLRLENGATVNSFFIQKEITPHFSINYKIDYHV